MRAWLAPLKEALQRGEAAMLVHVVELKGSGPRDAGAQMLVTEEQFFGTIGGGELEHTALLEARRRLQAGMAGVKRYALGPELNQCCGGSVVLVYEPFAPADAAWVRKLATAAEEPFPVLRSVHIEKSGLLRRDWVRSDRGSDYVAHLSEGHADIEERVNPDLQGLFLFGAGHVGKALAHAVQPLGFAMTWIDGRVGQLPDPPLAGVKQLALAMPELAVDEAPPDTVFLVMTHSHPLDEAVCEAVLRREDFAYLGLIGSDTKRARFVKRLGDAGVPTAQLQRLICPIGLPGILSKEPAAIAASVAADLLIRRERNLLTRKGQVLHGRR
jgi:xanthine dehydrogenase accessory factor